MPLTRADWLFSRLLSLRCGRWNLAGHSGPQGRNQTPKSALGLSQVLCGTPALEATAPSFGKWGSFHTEAGVSAPSPSLGEPWAATVSKNPSPHNHIRSGLHPLGKDKGAE